jgi:hypothetical protein
LQEFLSQFTGLVQASFVCFCRIISPKARLVSGRFSSSRTTESAGFCDAWGEIEASFNGRIDDGGFFDSNHCGSTFQRDGSFMPEQMEATADTLQFNKMERFHDLCSLSKVTRQSRPQLPKNRSFPRSKVFGNTLHQMR